MPRVDLGISARLQNPISTLSCHVGYWQAYRGKQNALDDLNGIPEEGYAKLPEYCEKLHETNSGTFIALKQISDDLREHYYYILETTPSGSGAKFRRLFISYKATIDGFIHCRPLLGLDRTHLPAKYGGILLAATAPDARGQLFLVAFAVVSAENDENWG